MKAFAVVDTSCHNADPSVSNDPSVKLILSPSPPASYGLFTLFDKSERPVSAEADEIFNEQLPDTLDKVAVFY